MYLQLLRLFKQRKSPAAVALLVFGSCLLLFANNARAQSGVQDMLELREVVTLDIEDPSGLSLHSEPGLLWTVSDEEGGRIKLITEGGQTVSTLPYEGEDMEGITLDVARNALWIVEERRREMLRLSLQGEVLDVVSLDIGQEDPNNGLEGITVNPLNGHLYVVNQRNPRVLFELDAQQELIEIHDIDFEAPFTMGDLSGLFYDKTQNELWLLSAASQKIVITDMDFQPLRRHALDIEEPEGIAVDMARNLVFIVCDEENLLYTYDVIPLMNPKPHALSAGSYTFDFWSAEEPDFSYPPHMSFQMSDTDDPGLTYENFEAYYVPHNDYNPDDEHTIGFPYNNTRRTRINGLGEQGISMINTGRGRDLGAVVLALNTEHKEEVLIEWEAGTMQQNNRLYALRLQYRISKDGTFTDLMKQGEPTEYRRGPFAGHSRVFEDIPLPAAALNQPYVQLRWKFYHTGEQTGGGGRDELRLDNIHVRAAGPTHTEAEHQLPPAELLQNYPNPFNPNTRISYILEAPSHVTLNIFNVYGQHVHGIDEGWRSSGRHDLTFDADAVSAASGIYFYQMTVNGAPLPVRQMLLLR